MHPPLRAMPTIPTGNHPGAFGARRKYHVHEGVDLYCDDLDFAFSMDHGVILWVGPFTGKDAGSPWWNDTEAVAVKHDWGVMFYGEILPFSFAQKGRTVYPGFPLGSVVRVLKKDKGTPTSMLHLELYSQLPEILPPKLWVSDRPDFLLDPTPLIQRAK